MRPRIHTEAEIIAAGIELGGDDPFAVSASQIHKKLEGRGRLSIVANVWDAHLEELEHAEAEEQPNCQGRRKTGPLGRCKSGPFEV